MAPGAVIPARRRPAEQIYVLEGDGAIAGAVLGAGDYCRLPAGLAPEASTRSGCTLLVISAGREALGQLASRPLSSGEIPDPRCAALSCPAAGRPKDPNRTIRRSCLRRRAG
jgi:hypothetical protein